MEMQKIYSLLKLNIIAFSFLAVLTACGGSSNNQEDESPVEPQDFAPTITVESSGSVARQFSLFVITIFVNDEDGDDVTVTVDNLPRWAEFDPELGQISGVPQSQDVGSVNAIVITASDGLNETESVVSVEVVDIEGIVIIGDVFGVDFDDYVISLGVEDENPFGFDFFSAFKRGEFTGGYLFEVPTETLDQFTNDLIILRVRDNTNDSSTSTDLISVLGTPSELVNLAGEDRILTGEEFSRLNLSPISTAKYLLSSSDGVIQTKQELLARENSLPATNVVELAALYNFVSEEEIDLGNNFLSDVFSSLDLSSPFEISNLVEQLNLEINSELSAEEILASIEMLEPQIISQSGVSSSFIVEELPGISVITQPFLSDELPYVVADVTDIGFDGRGEFYHRYNKGLSEIRTFGWNVSDSNFSMEFDSAQDTARVFVARENLVEDFGFDQAVEDFFADLPETQNLIDVRSRDIRTEYNVIFITDDRWHLLVEREVENNVFAAVDQADGDLDDLEVVRQIITESRVLITSEFTENRNLILEQDLVDQPWALPSRDITDFDRQVFDVGGAVVPEVYTLFGDGTSGEGDFGGPIYNWSILENDAIALEIPSRDTFLINPIFQQGNRYFGYVEQRFREFLDLLGAVEFSRVDEGSANLFSDEVILESIGSNSAPFWMQTNGKRSPNDFRSDGLLNVENIRGFLFDENGRLREVNGTLNECLELEISCFEISQNASSLTTIENPIEFTREGEFNFSEGRFSTVNTRWRVIDYNQETETALIIYSEIDDLEFENAITSPMIIQLQKRNLNQWFDEFANSALAEN